MAESPDRTTTDGREEMMPMTVQDRELGRIVAVAGTGVP